MFAKCRICQVPSFFPSIYLTPVQQRLVANSLQLFPIHSQISSLPEARAKFFCRNQNFAECGFCECKISANAEFCCVSSFLSANFSEYRVCHMPSFSKCLVFPTAESRVCQEQSFVECQILPCDSV